jgi:peroxiredoxin
VFSDDERDLRLLERECQSLHDSGTRVMAVVSTNDGEAWRKVKRLDLSYSLLADPSHRVGRRFGLYEEETDLARHAWYLIGHDGRVIGWGDQLAALAADQ